MAASVDSLHDLLTEQADKLKDLELATTLVRCKNELHDQLLEAFQDVLNISKDIDRLKEDLEIMKSDNQRCRDLAGMLTVLDHQITHMENNIPPQIQDYINAETPMDPVSETTETQSKENKGEEAGKCLTNSTIRNCKKTLFNELKPDLPRVNLLTEEEFNEIPKYIIGRQTLESINNLVTTINQIIKHKYSIMAMGKEGARKKGDLDLYLHYKKQQTSLGDAEKKTCFFTAEDYEKSTKSKLDKIKLTLIIALRHCKRLREIRTAKMLHYAINTSQ